MGSGDVRHWLEINRAAVLTLWASVVAERLGFDRSEALTLGRAVAGLNAYSKGKALGLFEPTPEDVREKRRAAREAAGAFAVDLLGRAVPAIATEDGIRALSKEKPMDPATVERYLAKKFGDALDDARAAMVSLAKAHRPDALAQEAYALYEAFRPAVPSGRSGWGRSGRLSLDRIRAMAGEA